MKTTRFFATDCDAHAACHSLAAAVEMSFPEPKLACTEHDISGIRCVHEGTVKTENAKFHIHIQSESSRELRVIVETNDGDVERFLAEIVAAYQSQEDAGGVTHSLEMKQ